MNKSHSFSSWIGCGMERNVYTLKEMQPIHFHRQRRQLNLYNFRKETTLVCSAALCQEKICRETGQQQFVHHVREQQGWLHFRVQGVGRQRWQHGWHGSALTHAGTSPMVYPSTKSRAGPVMAPGSATAQRLLGKSIEMRHVWGQARKSSQRSLMTTWSHKNYALP